MSPADTRSGPRIALLDSGLSRLMGHHSHFGQGLAQLCAREGVSLTTFTAKSVEAKLAPRLGGPVAVFARSLYQPLGNGDIYDRDWNDFRTGRQLYAADLDQSGLEMQASDLIWIPTARPREIAGLAEWLLKRERDHRPRVALGFHRLLRPLAPGSAEGLTHRLATDRLAEAVGRDRIFPYATNHRLAQRLAGAMNLGIYLAPLPHFYGALASPASPPALPPGDGPLLVIFGDPDARKNGVPLAGIVREALRQRPDLRFVIQVRAEADPGLLELEKLRPVKLVEGWLEEDAFVALIRAADLLLLPYRRERYADTISGPFAFAAAHERPAIVPAGTWMAERIARKQAAGVAYKRDAALIDALMLAADRMTKLKAQAAALAPRWRVWDAEALFRLVRQWSLGQGTGKLRRVDPKPPPGPR
ncbi:MAG TPA: hypothetical protein VHA10_15160 [Hypericibacter adhaerens]|uniref:glycosyltransferase n=1 Tax=Hypericibacter adhaerens TaxID=2602016 RepID=UPI002B76EF68|nr:hypothetical protein [Hypericibacter adhaerens]HWA44553.1 hypothetical protein [Hypericibacter adhaerens]